MTNSRPRGDDLMAAGQKFAEKGITTIAIGNKDMWPAESCILSCLGDRYTGVDWTNSIIANDGKAKFTDQPFVDALAKLKSMVPLFNVDYNTIQNNQGDDYYCQGEAASMVSGHWVVSYIESNATEDVLANTRVALLPPVDGGKGAGAVDIRRVRLVHRRKQQADRGARESGAGCSTDVWRLRLLL